MTHLWSSAVCTICSSFFCCHRPGARDEGQSLIIRRAARLLQGQWKQISRYYVPSRTPTQVASHAQKHFLRLSGATKRRSRFASVEDHATGTSTAPVPSGSQPTPPTHKAGPEQPVTSAAFSFGTSAQSMSVTAATLRVPPPVSADGVAVGIPVILPVPPCGVSGAIPMLRTLPGRITAPMAYSTAPVVEKARSPLPLRQQPAPRKPTTAPPSVTRPAPPEQWGEPRRSLRQTLKGGVSRKASRPGLHHHHHGSSGHAYSAASGSSDTGHYALDALAGVAAALADSAASMSD